MQDHSKKLAFLLVLLAHALAAVLVERSLTVQHARRHQGEPPPVLVSFLTLTTPSPAVPQAGPAQHRLPKPAPQVQAAAPVEPPVPAARSPAAADSSAITGLADWRAQAADAVRDAASAAQRAKPFGHDFAPTPERPEVGVFGPKNEHPAGTVDEADGVERHWVTDQCYYGIERHPMAASIAGPRTMSLSCAQPATGGTDMFKKQRPGYLSSPQPTPTSSINIEGHTLTQATAAASALQAQLHRAGLQ